MICFDQSVSLLLGSFAVLLIGCHSVPNAVWTASLPLGSRRSRTQLLSQPAPDMWILPSRIHRPPIRCKSYLVSFLFSFLHDRAKKRNDTRETFTTIDFHGKTKGGEKMWRVKKQKFRDMLANARQGRVKAQVSDGEWRIPTAMIQTSNCTEFFFSFRWATGSRHGGIPRCRRNYLLSA